MRRYLFTPPFLQILKMRFWGFGISFIDQANAYMNSKQWPGKAAMGRLTESEKAKYNAWLDYLDALEAVDTSSAPDINWPTPPAVA